MQTIRSYRDLDAWQLAMALAEAVYEITRSFPAKSCTGSRHKSVDPLCPLLQTSAKAIVTAAARIAYVVIALGCQAECETQLELAHRLALAPVARLTTVMELAARVGRVLHGLARSLPEE